MTLGTRESKPGVTADKSDKKFIFSVYLVCMHNYIYVHEHHAFVHMNT